MNIKKDFKDNNKNNNMLYKLATLFLRQSKI